MTQEWKRRMREKLRGMRLGGESEMKVRNYWVRVTWKAGSNIDGVERGEWSSEWIPVRMKEGTAEVIEGFIEANKGAIKKVTWKNFP